MADKCARCGGPLNAKPENPPRTVTFDVSSADALHVVTQALDDYAAGQSALAADGDSTDKRTGWAITARRFRDQADEAAGGRPTS